MSVATDPAAGILEKLHAGPQRQGRWGIGTAAHYLRQLGDGEQEIRDFRDAQNKLIYCDEGMCIESHCGAPAAGAKGKAKELPEGAVMVFDAIITSKRKDRDGDILEPDGARVDERSPLLWQHDHTMPVGRLLEIPSRSKQRIKGRFMIADTPLGRDAAQLIELGVLRISHGFLPDDDGLEDLEDKEGNWIGWHILKYEILEVSLVSVPSNTDAVITALNSDKLHHPAVKSWAKSLQDKRPVSVGVASREPLSGSWQAKLEQHCPTCAEALKKNGKSQETAIEPATFRQVMEYLASASAREQAIARKMLNAAAKSHACRQFCNFLGIGDAKG